MLFLSIFLAHKINRLLNIIIAILWSTMSVLLFVDTIASEWGQFYALYQFIEIIVFGMIIWQAYKWPKETEQA
jgi:hypothetical protein